MTIATLLTLALAATACADWVVVDNNYETIAMSLSFQQPTSGWVGGGSASLDPLLLYTTDGGLNFTNHELNGASAGAFLAIDVTKDGNTGVAGGFGFFGLPCGAYMNDGNTWTKANEGRDIICASQDADAIDANNLITTGTWVELTDFSGNGCQVSTDGGKKWSSRNWNQGTSARYASFLDVNTGFVSGGMWPEDSQTHERAAAAGKLPYSYSRHIKFDGKRMALRPHSELVSDTDGYVGIIAMATSEAKNFKTMLNLTNQGLYFNEISCVDSKNCWAAAEGVDTSTLEATAWIYHTSDGWSSYDVQATAPSGSILAIDMLNSTFGWAGGAILPTSSATPHLSNVVQAGPDAQVEGTFWQTTDGKTWSQYSTQLRNFYVSDISVVDGDNAYAAGLTSIGLSSFARYQS